jgi:hypothetical protein
MWHSRSVKRGRVTRWEGQGETPGGGGAHDWTWHSKFFSQPSSSETRHPMCASTLLLLWLPKNFANIFQADELWHELVIVRGHLSVIVRGLCLPRRSGKGNISGLLVSLSYLTCG